MKASYDQTVQNLKDYLSFPGDIMGDLFFRNYTPIWDANGTADISQFKEVDVLLQNETSYVIFYKNHKKFGKNVVEAGDVYIKNNGAFFFDWENLDKLYKILVLGDETIKFPHIPFYYAVPEDRYDLKHDLAIWAEREQS